MIELEDFFEDVIGKTLRGSGMSDGVLSFLSGVNEETIVKLKNGEFDEAAVRAVAPPLGLCADSLVELANRSWRPDLVEVEGLVQFNTDFGDDVMVNSYLIWDPETKEAALFDTGANADSALSTATELGLKLKTLFFTHTHIDHVIDREKIIAANPGIRVLVNGRESLAEAERFSAGDFFSIGSLRVETRLTRGHSPAGTTYVVHGLTRTVAVVGDAIFAQSMGGGAISFHDALETTRAEIFTLEDDTVICPGHGPMTSVGGEKAHNPFFPEFK